MYQLDRNVKSLESEVAKLEDKCFSLQQECYSLRSRVQKANSDYRQNKRSTNYFKNQHLEESLAKNIEERISTNAVRNARTNRLKIAKEEFEAYKAKFSAYGKNKSKRRSKRRPKQRYTNDSDDERFWQKDEFYEAIGQDVAAAGFWVAAGAIFDIF